MAAMIRLAQDSVSSSTPADRYADAALWLARNEPAGSFVFQTDWDDFPRLFFFNPSMIYTAGLDPTYMELHNADLFDQWVDITQGKVDRMGEVIRDQYGADFVFTDTDHEDFISIANEDPLLEVIYQDDEAVIFAVDTGEAAGSEG